jgi:hypothetical protein
VSTSLRLALSNKNKQEPRTAANQSCRELLHDEPTINNGRAYEPRMAKRRTPTMNNDNAANGWKNNEPTSHERLNTQNKQQSQRGNNNKHNGTRSHV